MSTFVQDDSKQGTSTVITEMAATAPIYAYTRDLIEVGVNVTASREKRIFKKRPSQ